MRELSLWMVAGGGGIGRDWKYTSDLDNFNPSPEKGNGKKRARGRASDRVGRERADLMHRIVNRSDMGFAGSTYLVSVQQLAAVHELVHGQELLWVLDARVEVEGGVLGEGLVVDDVDGTHLACSSCWGL